MAELPEKYLQTLQSVNRIRDLLYAAGYEKNLIKALLSPQREPYLDTYIATSVPRILSDFPPDFISELAKIDKIKARLSAVYGSSSDLKMRKKARRIWSCKCAFMLLFAVSANRATLVPYSCNSRFCPQCSREKSGLAFARAIEHVGPRLQERGPKVSLKWLTLTIKNPPFGKLDDGIKALLYAFRVLRTGLSHRVKSLWSTQVYGYLWALEVTINNRSRSWHPHIHVLADADYMKQSVLDEIFNTALKRKGHTGKVMIGAGYARARDGRVVKPRAGEWSQEQLHGAVKEVTKYTLKAMDSSRITADQIFEITAVLAHKRLMGSGGYWQIPTEYKPPPEYGAPEGLRSYLKDRTLSTADLLDEAAPVGRAHRRVSKDPWLAAGLARTYSASAHALRLQKDARFGDCAADAAPAPAPASPVVQQDKSVCLQGPGCVCNACWNEFCKPR